MSEPKNDDLPLKEALGLLGFHAPRTEDEVDQFLSNLCAETVIPEHIRAESLAKKVLEGTNKITEGNFSRRNGSENCGLARAARNGQEISSEILERMKLDRQINESEER